MARTQAADYDLRKLAIVEAAAELFAKRGFLGATLADLAEHCNSSKSLIYHYYPSKEDILYEVMATHVETLNAAVDEVEAQGGEPEDKLRRLTHALMHRYVGAANRHRVLLNDLDHLPADRRKVIVAKQRRLVDQVSGYLARLQPKLRRSRKFARPAVMLYFGMINWTHTWFDPAGPASADDVADLCIRLLLNGLPHAWDPPQRS
jgi:AcrR family transcriptional regulator